MTPRHPLRWLVLFCLGAMILSAAAGWQNSATNDEPEFLFAAVSAVKGHGVWVPLHPPLYKLVAGAPLLLLHLRGPETDFARVVAHYPQAIHAYLHENRVAPLVILRAARLGMLLFLPLLAWGTFRLGEIAGGLQVGLWAVLLVVSQPLVLGHAFLVHTDVPAACCWIWALVFGERLLARQPKAWWGLGFWLGLALLAKQSAVFLVLFLLLRMLVAVLGGARFPLAPVLAALGLALLTAYSLTAFTLRQVSGDQEQALILIATAGFPGGEHVSRVLSRLANWSVPAAHHLLGLVVAAEKNAAGQGINFFLGQVSSQGFLLYFPLALVAKLSAPFTGLWVAGALAWRSLSSMARWCLAYAGLYLLASLGASFNIGARHLMPVVPLLGVVGGRAMGYLATRWQRTAALALLASPLWSYPGYISHFSLFTGGCRYGEKLLNDSNLDWGQDWARVARLARQQGWFPLYALYLGPDDPAGYGAPLENLLVSGRLPRRGYVAVSSYTARVGPAYLEYKKEQRVARFVREVLRHLERCTPVTTVGCSIQVFSCGDTPNPGPAPPP